ncbi:MAG TPA: conjugal transfer protein TraG N-terminal domain-containing protein [Chlamydiales bacterium]|nr:conjugal transfer protein TraG N-terminal domain-containing protein [Chlamydiales bacterium]
MKALFLIIGLLSSSVAFSDTIYTYEGEELFEKVFQTIGSILYGNKEKGVAQTFHILIRISLIVGGFSAFLLAFFRQKFEPLIRNLLLPGLIIVAFLLVPKTTVVIENRNLKTHSQPIEVPFFLGKFVSLTTSSFQYLYQLFKTSISNSYPWISKIYANENFFHHHTAASPNLTDNLRNFCHECVFRDLSLGLYSKEELAKTPNVIDFLSDHASTQRAISLEGTPISCQEAIKILKEGLEAELIELKDSPFNQENSGISPQDKIMIDLLQEEIFHLKSKTTSPGAQGTIILITSQKFIEVLLYLLFPLVVLLSLLSFGLRIALFWMKSIVWVSTWPIFYLAIDLCLDAFWKMRVHNRVFNLENAAYLSDVYTSMEMIACAALCSIPFLSWMLLREGVSGLVSISSIPMQEPVDRKMGNHLQPMPMAHHAPENTMSRQTNWNILAREEAQKPPSDESFKTIVENSKQEEKSHALQNTLSSIRESIKDSSVVISKSLQDDSKNIPIDTSFHARANQVQEKWTKSYSHIPSHGSWTSQNQK